MKLIKDVVRVICHNCSEDIWVDEIEIPKGQTVECTPCPNCGYEELEEIKQ